MKTKNSNRPHHYMAHVRQEEVLSTGKRNNFVFDHDYGLKPLDVISVKIDTMDHKHDCVVLANYARYFLLQTLDNELENYNFTISKQDLYLGNVKIGKSKRHRVS